MWAGHEKRNEQGLKMDFCIEYQAQVVARLP